MRWHYSRLAQMLRQIGAPESDRQQLFLRMLYNALIGNDDDHPRNPAIIWREAEQRWRLSPAFDIVPAANAAPPTLAMQLSNGCFDISHEALMADARFFGFAGQAEAESEMQIMRQRLDARFSELTNDLPGAWRVWLAQRIEEQQRVLPD